MTEGQGYTMFFPVTLEDLHRHCKARAWRLLDTAESNGGHYRGVVAITRGGLVPAAIVARELEVRVIETISCSTYDGLNRTDKLGRASGRERVCQLRVDLGGSRIIKKKSE